VPNKPTWISSTLQLGETLNGTAGPASHGWPNSVRLEPEPNTGHPLSWAMGPVVNRVVDGTDVAQEGDGGDVGIRERRTHGAPRRPRVEGLGYGPRRCGMRPSRPRGAVVRQHGNPVIAGAQGKAAQGEAVLGGAVDPAEEAVIEGRPPGTSPTGSAP